MNTDQADHGIPLPMLSDEAAVEILYFLETMFQIFESHYANQISRYYDRITPRHTDSPFPKKPTDEPF